MFTVNDLARNYLTIWNETDADIRRALIFETWVDTASYVDPMFDVSGHDGIDAMVAGFQEQFPGLTFRQIGDAERHHDRVRFQWELVTAGNDVVAAGTDVGVIEAGRFRSITGFFDQAPVLSGT